MKPAQNSWYFAPHIFIYENVSIFILISLKFVCYVDQYAWCHIMLLNFNELEGCKAGNFSVDFSQQTQFRFSPNNWSNHLENMKTQLQAMDRLTDRHTDRMILVYPDYFVAGDIVRLNVVFISNMWNRHDDTSGIITGCQISFIGLDNGMVPSGHQAIIKTNDVHVVTAFTPNDDKMSHSRPFCFSCEGIYGMLLVTMATYGISVLVCHWIFYPLNVCVTNNHLDVFYQVSSTMFLLF